MNCEFMPKRAMATAKLASGAVDGRTAGAEVQAQRHVGRLGGGEERIPVVAVVRREVRAGAVPR